jgi:mRNA interferase MazF
MAYAKGDVVLVPFPFTDLSATRVRPAVVVSSDRYATHTSDVMVAMVTSQPQTGFSDCALRDWQQAGLIYPSWVRAKIATLAQGLVRFSPGRLSGRDEKAVERTLRIVLGLGGRR